MVLFKKFLGVFSIKFFRLLFFFFFLEDQGEDRGFHHSSGAGQTSEASTRVRGAVVAIVHAREEIIVLAIAVPTGTAVLLEHAAA